MNMNRVFYIFRHGETEWNRERRCQGHTNTCLNEMGRLQAINLANKLFDFPIDIIISSDLDRALATGKIVAEKKSIPLVVDPRLREMSYGIAEGMLFDEAIKSFGSELWQKLQSFKKINDDAGFPGGETRKDARDRFHSALLDIVEKTKHQSIGISTHGGALRNILHSFLPENHLLLPIPNCVVYKCEYKSLEKTFIVNPQPI
jgi:broad specificity phosphatase PhoE